MNMTPQQVATLMALMKRGQQAALRPGGIQPWSLPAPPPPPEGPQAPVEIQPPPENQPYTPNAADPEQWQPRTALERLTASGTLRGRLR